MVAKNRRLVAILATVSMILLIPLISMQFTTEVNWDITDFLVAGTLLLVFGLGIELILRKVRTPMNRVILAIAVLLLLLLLWAELAVGIFGTPLAGS